MSRKVVRIKKKKKTDQKNEKHLENPTLSLLVSKAIIEMTNKGCSPDAVSYTNVVSGLCKCKHGEVKEARNLLL